MVSNSLMVAALRRVHARKTARLISATSAFSTASTRVSCVLAAWSCNSFAVSSLPKGAILLKFISKSCVISFASASSGASKRETADAKLKEERLQKAMSASVRNMTPEKLRYGLGEEDRYAKYLEPK